MLTLHLHIWTLISLFASQIPFMNWWWTSCLGMTLPFQKQTATWAHIQEISSSHCHLPIHLPDSLSAGSSSSCCMSLRQSKALLRACPGSPDLCRSDTPSPSLSWTLVSCRWIPSGRICNAFWQSEAARCSSPPVGCWCLLIGYSTVHKIWAAACVDSGSGSVKSKTAWVSHLD